MFATLLRCSDAIKDSNYPKKYWIMEVEFREQLERCRELLEKYPQGMALDN